MIKVVTVIGARPQFIKAAPVTAALGMAGIHQILVHTGQHYDPQMSDVFFTELGLPQPDYHLGINAPTHGAQTGRMLEKVEEVLLSERPDWMLVYGDTNSTLAGALAAAKLHIPVAHVEAGLRSFNRKMPEEINRVMTDHVSDLLFCPTQTAVDLLRHEGITTGVHQVGDVMYDALRAGLARTGGQAELLNRLDLRSGGYYLLTVHRPANTDDPIRLRSILETVSELPAPVIFPLHPRTKHRLATQGLGDLLFAANLRVIEPVGYLDMIGLEKHARAILTDSGGVQKEAYMCGVQCITLRDETEWPETVASGLNVLVGADPQKIREAALGARSGSLAEQVYGDGRASERIAAILAGTV